MSQPPTLIQVTKGIVTPPMAIELMEEKSFEDRDRRFAGGGRIARPLGSGVARVMTESGREPLIHRRGAVALGLDVGDADFTIRHERKQGVPFGVGSSAGIDNQVFQGNR